MVDWDEQFKEYSEYVKDQKVCYIPSDAPLSASRLRAWQLHQIESFKEDEILREQVGGKARYKGKLSGAKVKKLKKIGFIFEAVDEFWDVWLKMYIRAAHYIAKEGSQLPLSDYGDKSLSAWMKRQKQLLDKKDNDLLHPKRKKLLKAINFPEGATGFRKKSFDKTFSELQAIKEELGRLDLNKEDNPKLYAFIKRQKEKYKNKKMDVATARKLRSLGITLIKRKEIKA